MQYKTENPETLATLGTHDKGQTKKNIKKKNKIKIKSKEKNPSRQTNTEKKLK